MTQDTEYTPPKDAVIERYAQVICEQYASQQNNPAITQPEVTNGLAQFLKVLFRLETQRLNQQET